MKKLDSGKYQVDMYPNGRHGKRIRKVFATAGEARRFENWVIANAERKPWEVAKGDNRRLSELVATWYKMHGKTCIDGKAMNRKLENMTKAMGDPLARTFNRNLFAEYRKGRLEKVAVRTVNTERELLAMVFNELIRLGEWKLDNPLRGMKSLKAKEREMGFLTSEQIPKLLDACAKSDNPDLYTIVELALSTGCRWSEAANLGRTQVHNGRVTFIKTKNGKHRTVPLSDDLFQKLVSYKCQDGSFGERLFSCHHLAFHRALAETDIVLPKGQATHALRHTFASHFMMNGGNIVVLKSILGHSDLKQTMQYSHFSPCHLQEVVRFNPLVRLG
ncbi:phage integrase [Ferrimonas pelagia]|uniref:Tyrosine-type recombinase/integrase n=1 Tax=Ferrimonas pelagia TaxID=1177826 RepID=A0ABP9F5N5_9GAMM